MTMQTREKTEPGHEDSPKILVIRINLANAADHNQFICSTQLDVKKPETYTRAMQGSNAAKWAKAMEEKLDQFHKYKTCKLVYKNDVESGHWLLGGKWVYKIKCNVDRNIACFKARWIVKNYF